ncbi:MAG: ACT domain-containing protein [Bacteroidetes Order II. Incertae sedis bacterium]|jgi:uncharacterized protein|nr:ACT domain-containing protein [Bacteroidetes Order II. bacterium]MBT4052740.1 ACT domain-containing protein [Bacteroidetes Order II. bacterium]MBT4603189.1 ACT domain-containing protein [Bacteroidetes Order II. bacterium]MBT5249537.1 ACT domain-containing protein [Bacteroidetes Order II. bacterium]MBT6201578.1 ACT domain-containing protein [Bacteroidetes Order II. bacterium]
MTELKLKVLEETFSVHRLNPLMAIPNAVTDSDVYFIGQTRDELSIVCFSDIEVPYARTESDWSCFMVVGPLDFNLTGIISRISTILAEEKISIFAISTFDTDYILVKHSDISRAQKILSDAGYDV